MVPAESADQAPVPPPAYHRSVAHALHLDALTLVQRLQLLELCALAVVLAQRQCSPSLPAGHGGTPLSSGPDPRVRLSVPNVQKE